MSRLLNKQTWTLWKFCATSGTFTVNAVFVPALRYSYNSGQVRYRVVFNVGLNSLRLLKKPVGIDINLLIHLSFRQGVDWKCCVVWCKKPLYKIQLIIIPIPLQQRIRQNYAALCLLAT